MTTIYCKLAWSPGPLGGSLKCSKCREAPTEKGACNGEAGKKESKERGPGEQTLHQLELGMWWAWQIFASAFFADTRLCACVYVE